jgi:hypothetical protein
MERWRGWVRQCDAVNLWLWKTEPFCAVRFPLRVMKTLVMNNGIGILQLRFRSLKVKLRDGETLRSDYARQ